MKRSHVALLLGLLVGCQLREGCGGRPPSYWVKDVSPEQRQLDEYECESAMRPGDMERCFQAKGYVLMPEGSRPRFDLDPVAWLKSRRAECRQSCVANKLSEACFDLCERSYR